MDSIATALLISLILNVALFLVAFKLKSDKLTDASYSVTFITLALAAFMQSDSASTFHIILTLMILLWAIRIGGFLLVRVMETGKDTRFHGIREDFIKFGRFWVGQGITVWVLMLAALFAYDNGGHMTLLSWIGVAVWLIGLIIETTADTQKYKFSKNTANKDRWIESGIWRYSRHPNYFGEILIWIGIYVYAFDTLNGSEKLIGLASPILICVLLLFISGIPILEASADKRWGKLKAYQTYKKQTSLLIPLPRRQ